MTILLYALCGGIIGWCLGIFVIAAGMLFHDLVYAVQEWTWGIRCRMDWQRTQHRWARNGRPAGVIAYEAQIREAMLVQYEAMPTMADVVAALEKMH